MTASAIPTSSPSSAARIGIAGAGVLGRLLAWQLAHAGHQVTVFDPAAGLRLITVSRAPPALPPPAC